MSKKVAIVLGGGFEVAIEFGECPPKQGLCRSRNLISASGPGWSLPFGREIARAPVGNKTADAVAHDMLF